jgi:hypothetical protein
MYLQLGGGLAALLLLGAFLWHLAQPPPAVHLVNGEWVVDRGEYVGVDACRDCHAGIVEQQLASSHANTIRSLRREKPRARFDTGQSVTDPLTGTAYAMTAAGGVPTLELTQGNLKATQRLEYEFGSGAHAHGYLLRDGGQWIDARLNYHEKIGGWDFASGQEKAQGYLTKNPMGRPQGAADIAKCFMCHSTVLRAEGAGKEPRDGSQLRVRPERSVLNVTCEGCHGPMGQHVRDRRAGKAVELKAGWTADETNQRCGRCHGINNVNPAHPVIARFQPWGLSQSECFLRSQGRLSCSTCHDPHENVRKDVVFYEKKCLSCHTPQTAGQQPCPVNPRQGCVGCHMPADSQSMLHITFTDHRIRVIKPAAKERLQAAVRTGR